ncbi:hypothetical protein MASR1M36_18190 [Candidatus Cloacimonadaceae bacterium]|jgi:hypothetical protein
MKNVYEYKDEHLGRCYLVIPKIRELSKALGNVVITFDNGDKRSLMVDNPDEVISELLEALESYHNRS